MDIVIGTHRLIQQDVQFKDLGLVVIDEEQRFGVTHKEYLKRLRTEVDVLTLTATPNPTNTLHGIDRCQGYFQRLTLRQMSACRSLPM